MNETKVLIVGAGPTGLMAACQLSRFKIPFRIIEKNVTPSVHSKALAVQARTMEIYDQMGIAQKAMQLGKVAEAITSFANGKKITSVDFSNVGEGLSPFPFVLMLEQSKNEKLLLDFLKKEDIEVEYGKTLIKLIDNGERVQAHLKETSRASETVYADWIIGADGASSTVRHSMNLKFEGGTYERIFVLADVRIDWKVNHYGHNQIFLNLFKDNFIAFFPMKGEARYRVVNAMPASQVFKDFQYKDAKTNLENNGYVSFSMNDCNWFSKYKVHHRCVANFRKGRCFLVGDSAHVHSPVEGQGMNTGLQDAYNLAWKLALVIQKKAKEEILNTYNEERLPFAKRLVRTTDRAFNLAISNNSIVKFLKIRFFPYFLKFFLGNKLTRQIAFKTISQIAINYRGLSLSENCTSGIFSFTSPKAGDRLPFYKVQIGKRNTDIFQLVKKPRFHLFFFEKEQTYLEKEVHEFCRYATKAFKISFAFQQIRYLKNEEVFNLFSVNGIRVEL